MYDLIPTDKTAHNAKEFMKFWRVQLKKEKPSMVKALFSAFGFKFVLAGILKFISDNLTFVGPFALNRIVSFIQGDTSQEVWEAWTWVLIMVIGQLSLSLVQQYYFLMVFRVSMKVRSAIVDIVYKKSFTLTSEARQSSTTGEIVNHMAIDSQRILDLIPYLHQIWSGPYQIIICLIALGFLLQWALLAGIGFMLLLIPINTAIIGRLKKLQTECMLRKDERVKMMSEILQGIRVIKFFAWEESFRDKVNGIRDWELKQLRKTAYLNSVVMFMWMSAPLFVSIVTFATYMLYTDELSASVAFTSLSLFNILRFPLNMIPTVIAYAVDAAISLKRLTRFLTSPEADHNAIRKSDLDMNEPALVMEHAEFSWQTESASLIQNLNLVLRRGELLAIVGSVGAGKSSLLSAILGDMIKREGEISLSGSVAYVSQKAWIQNSTVRDNIIFGFPFDRKRYERAIQVCELEADLEMLPGGDLTEIGENGINLSGGQKQRVAMARAVYANQDIYLLDDPLSAVDAHVGKAMFDNCICECLHGKSRILVTHQLQHLSKVDRIVVMKDGRITEMGSYKELTQNTDGEFARLIEEHVTVAEEADDDELDDGEGAADGENKKEKTEKKESKLIDVEGREVGEVNRQVYFQYILALGGPLIVGFLLFFFAMEQTSKTLADWWLSWWSDNPGRNSWFYIGIYAALGLTNGFFVLTRSLLFAFASLNSAKVVHDKMLENVLHFPMSFFDTTPAGRILNRFSKDIYTIDQNLPRTMAMMVVMVFGTIAILAVIGAVTPFFLTAVLPLGYIYNQVQKYYIRTSREVKRLDSTTKSPIFSLFSETLAGVATIKAFDLEKDFIHENERKIDQNQRPFWMSQVANRWLGLRLELMGTTIISLAAFFLVLERDNVDPGSAGLSLTYALQMTSMLNWLVRMYTELEGQMVSVERCVEYTTLGTEAPHHLDIHPPEGWPANGKIEFRDYKLRYREGLELVLKGITCTINPREKVGVVGRTGVGKSTLMLALFRLVEPAAGSILIDGEDITRFGLFDLRRKIGIIPQDPTLFTGTFRSNLDPFGNYNDHQMWEALEAVHLKKYVAELPEQLDDKISEGGSNISVGQRQLMCLARALLRQAKILIMDEATASVDFETDALIQKTIRQEFSHCTVLTIAHRIHTIEDYDRVMVLDKGLIAEFDSPQTLLQQPDSLFYGMAHKSGTSASTADLSEKHL